MFSFSRTDKTERAFLIVACAGAATLVAAILYALF